MPLTLDDLTSIYPDQVLLEFSQQDRDKTWKNIQSQPYSSNAAQKNAYLNRLCLNTFLNYLDTEPDLQQTPQISRSLADLPSVWEFVNGTAIELGKKRLILIPDEEGNMTELRVPREWLEIPEWAGNYYLAVEINLVECWLRVCGYATFQQLLAEGKHDRMDESYVLEAEALIEDLSVMWVAQEIYPSQKPTVNSLPTLSSNQVTSLLEQLGQPTPYSPRLEVSFAQWAPLMANPKWRQEIYERRLGQKVASNTPTTASINLGQWFEQVFAAGWQSLDDLLNTGAGKLVYSFRKGEKGRFEERNIAVEGVKLINWSKEQSVALLIGLTTESNSRVNIQVQLHPAGGEPYLPAKIRLALLSSSGAMLQESIAQAQDNLIRLKRFTCPRGKGFKLEVTVDDFSLTEDFAL